MQIRKCEAVTTLYSGEIANLDPEKFRNLSFPYEGNTNEDFLEYIEKLIYKYNDMTDEWEEKLDEETNNELWKLIEAPQEAYWHSTMKGANEWFESGVDNEENRKNGDFDVEFSTQPY